MKALKLKSQTRYNYYLEWQKDRGITPSSPPSGEAKGSGGVQPTPARSSLPSGEAIGGINETKPVKKAPVQQSQEPEGPNEEEAKQEQGEAKGKDRAQSPIVTF